MGKTILASGKIVGLAEEDILNLGLAPNIGYWMEQSVRHLATAIKVAHEEKEKAIVAAAQTKDALEAKVESVIGIKKIEQIKTFALQPIYEKLYTLQPEKIPSELLASVEEIYKNDLITAQLNEKIVEQNEKTVKAIITTMELAGIVRSYEVFKNSRSKTKITVDAGWVKEVKKIPIKSDRNSWTSGTKDYLDQMYATCLRKLKELKLKEQAEKDRLEGERVVKEQLEKAAKIEAVLIAHACIKFNINPMEVSTREMLDEKLLSMGEVPYSVMELVRKELGL